MFTVEHKRTNFRREIRYNLWHAATLKDAQDYAWIQAGEELCWLEDYDADDRQHWRATVYEVDGVYSIYTIFDNSTEV